VNDVKLSSTDCCQEIETESLYALAIEIDSWEIRIAFVATAQ
jgi:hypothetical protein